MQWLNKRQRQWHNRNSWRMYVKAAWPMAKAYIMSGSLCNENMAAKAQLMKIAA